MVVAPPFKVFSDIRYLLGHTHQFSPVFAALRARLDRDAPREVADHG